MIKFKNNYQRISTVSSKDTESLTLIYYDKTTDSSEVIELNGRMVTVSNDNIDVNINEKYFISFGKKVLLFTPDNLKPVFKTIDN